MNGWIKLHRRILDNDFLMHDPTAFIVFTKLLLLVNSATGNYSGGRINIGERVGIYPITLYKCLKRLEKHKMVTLSSNNRFTTIHICNWKEYQSFGNTSSNNPVTTGEQQDNTIIRNKELRNNIYTKYSDKKENTRLDRPDYRGQPSPAKEILRKKIYGSK